MTAKADSPKLSQSALYDSINKQLTAVYVNRSEEEIEAVKSEIEQLTVKTYKTPVETSLANLEDFLKQIDLAKAAVIQAETSKSEADIAIAKSKVSELTDGYQKSDQNWFNSRIDAVVAGNALEKVKAEQAAQAAKEEAAKKASNPLGLKYTGYSSIEEARALRNMIEQGGNMNVNLGMNYSYIGGYGFATSTWTALSNKTGSSLTDFSIEHQNLLADQLVLDYFGGDWGNVPRSGGW